MSLAERFSEYVRACFTGIWIESHEHDDALAEIAALCRQENWRLAIWDVDRGLQLAGQEASDPGGSDPLSAIRSLGTLAAPDSSALLVLVNFHKFLNSAEVAQALARQISLGKPKIFRDSAITNRSEFFGRFGQLNVRSSEQLDDLVAQAQRIVRGIEPQELRDSASLRQHVATQLAGVQSVLDGLLVDRPRRNILRRPR